MKFPAKTHKTREERHWNNFPAVMSFVGFLHAVLIWALIGNSIALIGTISLLVATVYFLIKHGWILKTVITIIDSEYLGDGKRKVTTVDTEGHNSTWIINEKDIK